MVKLSRKFNGNDLERIPAQNVNARLSHSRRSIRIAKASREGGHASSGPEGLLLCFVFPDYCAKAGHRLRTKNGAFRQLPLSRTRNKQMLFK
jgi:hypothetical protein